MTSLLELYYRNITMFARCKQIFSSNKSFATHARPATQSTISLIILRISRLVMLLCMGVV